MGGKGLNLSHRLVTDQLVYSLGLDGYSCIRFMIEVTVSCQEDGFPRLYPHLLGAWIEMSVDISHILLQKVLWLRLKVAFICRYKHKRL